MKRKKKAMTVLFLLDNSCISHLQQFFAFSIFSISLHIRFLVVAKKCGVLKANIAGNFIKKKFPSNGNGGTIFREMVAVVARGDRRGGRHDVMIYKLSSCIIYA